MMHGNNDRFAARLDKMVKADRVTKEEAARLRTADANERDEMIRQIQLKHARTRLDAAVGDGRVTSDEADDIRLDAEMGEGGVRRYLNVAATIGPGVAPRRTTLARSFST